MEAIVPNPLRKETCRELAEACCLVLPSFQETLPVAIAEAMAAGVPVVASAVGGVPEMIEEGKSGYLVDPHRPDQIADRVLRILKDPGLAAEIIKKVKEASRVPVSVKFRSGWDHVAAGHLLSVQDMERSHPAHMRRCKPEGLGSCLNGLRAQPAKCFLCFVEDREKGGAPVRVVFKDVVESFQAFPLLEKAWQA